MFVYHDHLCLKIMSLDSLLNYGDNCHYTHNDTTYCGNYVTTVSEREREERGEVGSIIKGTGCLCLP